MSMTFFQRQSTKYTFLFNHYQYYKDTQFWQGKWTAYGGITGSTPGGAGTVLLQVRKMDIMW
jgi:hypothetical protein